LISFDTIFIIINFKKLKKLSKNFVSVKFSLKTKNLNFKKIITEVLISVYVFMYEVDEQLDD